MFLDFDTPLGVQRWERWMASTTKTKKQQLDFLGEQLVDQDMSETAIGAWVGLGRLLGAVAVIYIYRKSLLRLGFVIGSAFLVSTGKGAEILRILMQ